MRKAWSLTKEQVLKIPSMYTNDKMTMKQIANLYEVNPVTIFYHLKRANVPFVNKYPIKEDYFDKIDSEDKAYFLGLLYADGCNNEKRNAISIGLQEKDKYILEIFREKIGLSKPLSFRNRKKEKVTYQNEYKLNIINKKLSKRLSELGCWTNKSMTLQFPDEGQIPNNLLNHFIRGVWDGDGHVGLHKRKKNNWTLVDVSLTSTEMFCDKLSKVLRIKGINTSITAKNKSKITRQLHINSRPQAVEFLNWIYKDSTVFLKRKYDKYQEIKKSYEEYNET